MARTSSQSSIARRVHRHPAVAAYVGRGPETRILEYSCGVIHLQLEADDPPALLLAVSAEDLLTDAKVRLAPRDRLLGVRQREADPSQFLQDLIGLRHRDAIVTAARD